MSIDVIVPAGSRKAYDKFHFAPAVRSASGLILCSGVIGTDADGKVPAHPEEEFRNAWRAIEVVLQEAKLGLEDILDFTSYHVGLQAHLSTFMAVKDEFLNEPWPAWTAIGVSELAVPGARVEIRVVLTQ